MKPLKIRLIIAAAVFLFSALVLPISCAKDEKNQGVPQDIAVLGTILPQPKMPVLKIGGKETPDVYLQSLDIQVEVTGNIASTRHTMVFKNKTGGILEGELTFPLPDGRSVTDYALDINGAMRQAVPVEKAKATQVFEEIERRQVDPGLLERVEGNNFRTRIYPIPANGIRTISIGYEEELALENELLYYRLPMAYPDPLEKFTVKATVWKGSQKPLVPESEDEIRFDMAGENYVASFTREDYQPERSLIFALPAPADIPQVMMQSAQGSYYFLASVAPRMGTRTKQWDNELAIIWDVSLSASQRNLQREMEMLDILFAEKENANIHLYFLNNKLKKITNGNWNKIKNSLETAVFDGGTDFSQIKLSDIAGKEILFFSDGISTLSDADFLKNTNAKRPIHCIVSSAKADYSAMKLIAGKTKGKLVNINAMSLENLKNELLNETLQFLGMEHGNDVREAYPSIATPVQGNFSVAGISGRNNAELTLLFGFGAKVEKRISVKLDAKDVSQGNVYTIWAQKKIAELDLDYEKNRTELTELGQQFGIVTRNTSLMVLETIEDYLRYGIAMPAELQAVYQSTAKGLENDIRNTGRTMLDTERTMLDSAVHAAENIKNWWNTDFTAKAPKYPVPDKSSTAWSGTGSMPEGPAGLESSVSPAFRDMNNLYGRMEQSEALGLESLERSRRASSDVMFEGTGFNGQAEEKIAQPTITIKSIKKDNDYLKKLTGKTADDYQAYLQLRDDYANSPTYYFDMADWFYTHNDKETALCILTSIADLELENASLYRLLGYRLKEYGEYALEKFVCQKVIQWRPMEPQSYRDYALALADNGEAQAALDSLYSMLTRPFPINNINRNSGMDEVAVTEINHLIARNPRLNTSKIDKRLIINIPVDVRVVINWNMNNTDIDLHVLDPNGEECFYSHRETSAGGRISADNTNGYGPEQFLLKKATKGKYRVYVNYYGDRQFTSSGPSTIMAEIFTKYAAQTEQRRLVSLQMSFAPKRTDGKVEVAEFEF